MDGDRSPQPGPSGYYDDEFSEDDTDDDTYVSPFDDLGEEFFQCFNNDAFLSSFNALKETAEKNVDNKLRQFFGENYDLDAVVNSVLGSDDDVSESDEVASNFDNEDSLTESESSLKTAHASKENEEKDWITSESPNTSKTETDIIGHDNGSPNGSESRISDGRESLTEVQSSVSQCETPNVHKPRGITNKHNKFESSDISDKGINNKIENIKDHNVKSPSFTNRLNCSVKNETVVADAVKVEVRKNTFQKCVSNSKEPKPCHLDDKPASNDVTPIPNSKTNIEDPQVVEKSNTNNELESPESPPPNDRECNSSVTCREIPTVNLSETADSNVAFHSAQSVYNAQNNQLVYYPHYIQQWENYVPNPSGLAEHNQLVGASNYQNNNAGVFPISSNHMNSLGTSSLYCGISNSNTRNELNGNNYVQSSSNVWPQLPVLNSFGNDWQNAFGSTNNYCPPQVNQTSNINCGTDPKLNNNNNVSPESPPFENQVSYEPFKDEHKLLSSNSKKAAELFQNAQYYNKSTNQSTVLNGNIEHLQVWTGVFSSDAQIRSSHAVNKEVNSIKPEISVSFTKATIGIKSNEVSRKQCRLLNEPVKISKTVNDVEYHSRKIKADKFDDSADENSRGNIRESIGPQVEIEQDKDGRKSIKEQEMLILVNESFLSMSSKKCGYKETEKRLSCGSNSDADQGLQYLRALISSYASKNHKPQETESENAPNYFTNEPEVDNSQKKLLVGVNNIKSNPDCDKSLSEEEKGNDFHKTILNSMKGDHDSPAGQSNDSKSRIEKNAGKKKIKEQNKEKHEKKKSAKKENKIKKSGSNEFKDNSESSLQSLNSVVKLQDKEFCSAKKLQKRSDSNSPVGFCDKTNNNKKIVLNSKVHDCDRYSISPTRKISKSKHSKTENDFNWNNECQNHDEEDSKKSPGEKCDNLRDRSDYSSKSNKFKGQMPNAENERLHDDNDDVALSNLQKTQPHKLSGIDKSERDHKRLKNDDKRYHRHSNDKYWDREDIQKDIEYFERRRMMNKDRFGDFIKKNKNEFNHGRIHRRRSRSRSFNEDNRFDRRRSNISSENTFSKKESRNSYKYKDDVKNISHTAESKKRTSRERVRSPIRDRGYHRRKLKDRSYSPVENSKHYRRKSRDKSLSPSGRSRTFDRTKSRSFQCRPEKEQKIQFEGSVKTPPANECLVPPGTEEVFPQVPNYSCNETSQYPPTWQNNPWTPFSFSGPNINYNGCVPPSANVVPQNEWTYEGDQSFQPAPYYNNQQYFYS